jgi:hypothetical protein
MITSSIRDGLLLRRLSLVVLGSFAVLALAGCGIFSPDESDDGGGINPVVDFKRPIVDPDLPDQGRGQLVANLELAYAEMNYVEYEKLIHDSYIFRVDPADINIVGSAELSAAEDLDSTAAMFGGETGLEKIFDDDGNLLREDVVPAVQTIRLDLNPESASSWTYMETGEFAGTWRLIYDVDMTVVYSGETRTDQITGKQVFYVVATKVIENGNEFEVWQLRAWEDQGINS